MPSDPPSEREQKKSNAKKNQKKPPKHTLKKKICLVHSCQLGVWLNKLPTNHLGICKVWDCTARGPGTTLVWYPRLGLGKHASAKLPPSIQNGIRVGNVEEYTKSESERCEGFPSTRSTWCPPFPPPPTHEHVPLKYSLDQKNKFDAEIDGIHALR